MHSARLLAVALCVRAVDCFAPVVPNAKDKAYISDPESPNKTEREEDECLARMTDGDPSTACRINDSFTVKVSRDGSRRRPLQDEEAETLPQSCQVSDMAVDMGGSTFRFVCPVALSAEKSLAAFEDQYLAFLYNPLDEYIHLSEIGFYGSMASFDVSFPGTLPETPVTFAHMQTTNGGNTAGIRMRRVVQGVTAGGNPRYGVDVFIEEEESGAAGN